MSGGHFDYDQRRIQLIIEKLEELIETNGKKIDYDPEYSRASWENEYEHEYPEDIIDEFKNGLVALKKAFVYTQRID